MIKRLKTLYVATLVVLLTNFPVNAQVGVTKDNLNQNADQSQGNYDSTNLNYLGGVGSLGMMQSAWKDPLQHMGEGQTRPGYTKYYWTPELVLPVRIREGMYTLINFPSWEVIENVYIGDGVSFNAKIEGPSSLMVYPDSSQFVGVDTNMIVFGRSGNKYVFYVQSETVNTDRITNAIIDIEVLKDSHKNGMIGNGNGYSTSEGYTSGADGNVSKYTRDNQKEDWIQNIPVDPTKFRFDIEVYVPNPDDIIIAPERVWRDNIFTYIDLGEKALTSVQRPIVTLIVERSETPVGFRTAGPNNRLIIVEGMGDMVLRSGKRLVCLKLRRADSDGLENTIYAQTNEWDLQFQKDKNKTSSGEQNYEDVYGSNSGTKSGTTQEKLNAADKNSNFFNNSSFFQSVPSNNVQRNTNGMGYEEMISDKRQNNLIPNGQGNNYNNVPNINNIPTVNPIVSSGEQNGNGLGQGYNNSTDTLQRRENMSGENPQYTTNSELKNLQNGQNSSETMQNTKSGDGKNDTLGGENARGIDSQKDSQNSQLRANDAASFKKAEGLGNSSNNSNPILITQQDNYKDGKSMVSSETEALLKEFRSGRAFPNSTESNISIELGTDENVNNLEKLWMDISKHYSAAIGKYQPFYSVDTAADGQGKELFHLRVGPVKSLEEGDNICSQLGRNGIFCSVVRIQ